VGDGCTIAGIAKGLVEMHALGMIDRVPRVLGVQAAGVAPVKYALDNDELPASVNGTTIADGINVAVPRNWRKAVKAIRASEGAIVTVTDEEMLAALAQAGRHGVFGEPAAAAGIAGVKVAVERGIIGRQERVLAVLTGSGLKDTVSAMKAVGQPILIEADLEAVSAGIESFQQTRAS
jgi:threonine synthase